MILNPKAIETARELDAERKAKGPRSALHGISVVLKDNYNTADLPTTGGSVLLEGSIPPADAFIVKKLREVSSLQRSLTRSCIRHHLAGPHCSPRRPTPVP